MVEFPNKVKSIHICAQNQTLIFWQEQEEIHFSKMLAQAFYRRGSL